MEWISDPWKTYTLILNEPRRFVGGKKEVGICGRLSTGELGPHKLIYGIYLDDEEEVILLAGGTEYFDVESTVGTITGRVIFDLPRLNNHRGIRIKINYGTNSVEATT